MRVDVYVRADENKQRQYLLMPEGQTDLPEPAQGKAWQKLFAMSTDEPSLDVPTHYVETDINHKGFAILRLESWSKEWSEASEAEIADLEEPSGWQDKWHQG